MFGFSPLRAWGFRGAWAFVALLPAACAGPAPTETAAVQWAADSATVRLAAGPQYARGKVWRFFWGQHYRDLWATPVTVPVLRLATSLSDSLIPLRAGGSFQSHTLRLRVASGHQFVLRSVDKDMSAALPEGFWRRRLGRLMKDQTSATLPYGAYIAAQLAEAAGVYHANPRLVYLPDDRSLGAFRASYANALYLLEERPDGNQQRKASFGRSPAVVNSHRMLAELRRHPRALAEPRPYLRARLLDMWLGDWSRRADQWRWASFPQAGRITYRPIPRDRDQAFFLFDDGFFTRVLSWILHKFQTFHAHIKPGNVDSLSITARALDRTLLASLSAEDFRREADSLRSRLTDSAIARALATGPPETRAAIAARLAPLLHARRADLPAVARRYYELLNQEAWVVGTDQAERFVVQAAGPGQLRVRVLALRPLQPDSLVSERVYLGADTRTLELYGLGGNDVFELGPSLPPGFPVHLYPGTGLDVVQAPANGTHNVTWHARPEKGARQPKGLAVAPDLHPELSANAAAWLRRYNLRD